MTTKHKILSITVLEKGRRKPTEHVACFLGGKYICYLPNKVFHFTWRDLLQGKKDTKYFDGLTLISFKVLNKWY